MSINDLLSIDLRGIGTTPKTFDYTLGDDFFRGLEQDELCGGDVAANLTFKTAAGDIIQLHATLNGTVRTLCDRCLEEIILPVDVEESLRIVSEGSTTECGTDIVEIAPNATRFDAAWLIYELCVTALPTERKHALEECDSDMAARIRTHNELASKA